MVADLSGTLYVVATPIGHLDDITGRALETLRAVDLIAAEDTRHTGRLLAHFGIKTPMSALHEHNESDMTAALLESLRAGADVALVSDAGTPLISDPGFKLVRVCREQGVTLVPVPGPSALIAALSVSGLPTDRFRFEGFLPRKAAARQAHLRSLTAETATMVFYESAHRIMPMLADLCAVFEGRLAVIARELTKLHESVLMAPLDDLHQRLTDDLNQRRGEFVILVAGAPGRSGGDWPVEAERTLKILLNELPVRQATSLAARLTGLPKNELYKRAIAMRNDG